MCVCLGDHLTFIVIRKINPKVGYFMGVMAKRTESLSHKTGGIIGKYITDGSRANINFRHEKIVFELSRIKYAFNLLIIDRQSDVFTVHNLAK